MPKKNNLLEKFPDLAKEWDYKKNFPLKPEDVTYGSKLSVYWLCPICNQSYPCRISNRTAPSKTKKTKKCPICLGKIIIPDYNSLQAKYPDIVTKEWDYKKNTISPNTIAPHTNKTYWWLCPNGHSYKAKPNNKTNNNGGNCPYCSHQKLLNEYSLSFINPKLAKEWHYQKNKKTPDEVFANSNSFAWWKCDYGHIWKAKINNRNNGRGCPECSKGRNSSFPEQVIFYYIKNIFSDSINRYKHNNIEIDVFIPSLGIGIEYDGSFYHRTKNKIKKDIEKNIKLYNENITLIRIRENGCYKMEDKHCVIYQYTYTSDYSNLTNVLKKVIEFIFTKANLSKTISIDINQIRNNILKDLAIIPKGKDLESVNPELAKDWDYKKNHPLTPKMVLPGSERKVAWRCHKCGYKWEANINSRNRGHGCHKCANLERYTTKSFISKCKEVHGDKYDYTKTIYINSKEPITFICKFHGEIKQIPSEHLNGKGCKYCAGQEFHNSEVLSICYPHLVSEWDYNKNLSEFGITPETAYVRKKKKYYWFCNFGKPHSYKASINDRIKRNMQCAVCHGKQHSKDRSLGVLYPKLAKEWSPQNDKTPFDVTPGSEYLAIWNCSNPNHESFIQSVYNRCHNKTQCPYCSGNKKHPKDYEDELKNKFNNISIITPYKKSNIRIKCKCDSCGHIWEQYPYSLLKSKGCPICNKSFSLK